MAKTDESLAEKMKTTLELFESGVEMMRQNLRRAHPLASPEEISRKLEQWLLTRPGAELGDAEGTPLPLSRLKL